MAAAGAATIEVSSLADSGTGSLREAIATAADGDTIKITATGSLGLQSPLVLSRPVTVNGPGISSLKVRRGEGAPRCGIFEVYATGSVTLRGMTLTDGDNPDAGGAIHRKSTSPLLVEDCLFIANKADGSGGAMWLTGGGTVTIRRCTLQENKSTRAWGGGVYLAGGKLEVSESSFTGGSAAIYGGGLHLATGGMVDITNCTFSGNTAARAGGALSCESNSWATILSSTMTLNDRDAIYNAGAKVSIGNSIISGNTNGYDYSALGSYGYVTSLGYNLIGTFRGTGSGFTQPGDKTGVTNPKLQPLGYYGGSNPVHPPQLDSVDVIDRGLRTLDNVTLTTDQHGKPRPVLVPGHEAAAGGDRSDIGAIEVQGAPQYGPILVVNRTEDTDDGVASEFHCTLREAMRAANWSSSTGTTVRFDPAVFGPGKPPRVISLASELPRINYRMSIEGPGAKFLTVRRGSESKFSVFSIGERSASGTISGLTIANGYDGLGGGIYVFSSGQLALTDCHVTNCRADYEGGGVFCKDGKVVIKGCTFFANRAGTTAAAVSHGFGEASIENSTFQGNTAVNGPGTITTDGTMSLTACTIVDNYPSGIGGLGATPALTARNCIITRNYKTDVDSNVVSGGFNLVRFGNKTFVNGVNGDQTDVLDPKLGPLKDNGGRTFTMAPQFGSPVLDKGASSGLTVDQRGFKRPFDLPALPPAQGGDHADIGAFELGRMTFAEWQRQAFTDEQLASAVAAPGGDANDSRVPNTLKHLFGLDPLQPLDAEALKALPQLIPSVEDGRCYLTITYRRSALYAGPQEVVEISPDLKEWKPAVVVRSSSLPSAEASLSSVVSVTVDVTDMPKAYLRVSQPD
ncbi:choice-of-anchor Q domain-containing protein [Haloferula sp. BvORR071]|uniref:choice-of-anchor Q domain-containing protein n=1 Tax=Haloferula sp. BvORR071 TaxID=1396141 RepID=UPI000551BAE3|nr:choice-of-anchor Q domain-containing protein [Haloferula sp. BvORR071]